ncbi:energy transducer TonB [Hymenobacter cheonanensis]|uniref:energy transducer TonB n=1 Tax=Hymenobacter sp. CA2-7 TaxID=3063993 RepID=UPI002712998D|nr:energy transducer TonB [Hymenobacter sp. CA2-7]MDO7886180.1 energy transducer TonB [Hymenobacter sp. CA2-7]
MSLLPAFLTDSLDEVVFEGRNQAYGAYQLRQDYQQNLASAGGLTLMFGALLFLGWASWSRLHPVAAIAPSHPVVLKTIDVKPPAQVIIEKPKVAVAPPRARAAATHVAPAIPTQVAKDDVIQPKLAKTLPTEIVDGATSTSTTDIDGLGDPSLTTSVGKDGAENTPSTAPTSSEPFVAVEKMPEFTGGQAALLRYLQKHLRYPSSALAAGVGGRVFMSFVVGADGSISEVTILKGLGYGLDEEAQRVIRQMPAWVPGYQSKHPVPVRFTLPITFSIQ